MDNISLKRSGYFNTALGWIPEHWEIKKLYEIGTFLKGKGVSKEEILKNGFPCITYGEIYTKHNFIIKSFNSFINEKSSKESVELKYGDILFAGSGETLEDIGKCAAFVDNFKAYAGGDIIILRQSYHIPEYLGYLLNQDFVNKQKYRFGQGHSVVHIYSSSLRNIIIPLPPIAEQQKIARILSACDRTIETTKKLITKKQERNKGLMQQLLTGEGINDQFVLNSESWVCNKLGKIISCFSGGTPSRMKREYYGGTISWIKSGELNNTFVFQTEEYITASGLKNSSAKLIKPNTLLLALYGATAGVLAFSKIEAAINQAILAIFPNEKIDKLFLYYYLKYKMPNYLKKLVQGGQPNLSATLVKNLQIKYPARIEVQQKIASVLVYTDNEIKTMQKQLEKLKQQKNGLMQVLLTGEKRVVYEQEV